MTPTETNNSPCIRRYGVIFAMMIFAATFMPTKFFWLPLVTLLVLFTASSWRRQFSYPSFRFSDPLLALVLFTSYAVLSSLRGDDPMHSLGKVFLLCALIGCGYLLVQNSKNIDIKDFQRGGRIAKVFLILGIIGYLVVVFESFTHGVIYRNFWIYFAPLVTDSEPKFLNIFGHKGNWAHNPQYAAYALLVFPMAMLLKSKLARGLLLGFVLVGILFLSANQSAMVGLLVGIGIVVLLPHLPERLQSIALWGLLGAFIAVPFLVAPFAPAPQFIYHLDNVFESLNVASRFDLYKATILDIFTQPWLGYGRDASRIDRSAFLFGQHAHYPHNFILQIWLELGIFGVVLFVWFLGSILHTIQKMNSHRRFYALGAFFCALSPVAFNYNLWSSWVIGLFCTITWLFFLFRHETKAPSTSAH